MTEEEAVEPPSSVGVVVGEDKWFVPMIIIKIKINPSLLTYHGWKGFENGETLAERFLRLTTWAEYCNEVSCDGC